MAILPQIDNPIITNAEVDPVLLPSKTYKINENVATTFTKLKNPSGFIRSANRITIFDSAGYNASITNLEGRTEQRQLSGRNQFNGNNPTGANQATTQFSDDIVTVSSTTTSTIPYSTWVFDDVQPGDIFRLKGIILDADGRIVIQWYDGSSWNGYNIGDYIDGVTPSTTTYTVVEGITRVRFLLYANKRIPSSASSSRYKEVIVTKNNTDMTYEEYCGGQASPNPNYPQGIKNVNNDITIDICNENFYNKQNSYAGGNNNAAVFNRRTLPKGNYTFYANEKTWCTVQRFNKNNELVDTIGGTSSSTLINFEMTDEINNINCYFSAGVANVNIAQYDFTNVMIVKGTYTANTLPSYVEHHEQLIDFPLSANQKMFEGDYLADDGIHHFRKQLTFTGASEENWDIRNDTHEMRINLGANAIYNSILKSDKLNQVSSFSSTGNNIRWVLNSTVIVISSDSINTSTMTINDWKNWLAENNLTIEYGINETVEPYTPSQQIIYDQLKQIILNYGINYIEATSDDLNPIVSLIYYKQGDVYLETTQSAKIAGFVDKLDAVKQAIYHILMTERYSYEIYSDNYGVELEQYIGRGIDYLKATIEKTLQEALLMDLRIVSVSVTDIQQITTDTALVNFNVVSIYGNLQMEVNINV